MEKGLFITFEGIDGCGKTTQLNLARKIIENEGFEVLVTKEPGDGRIGEEIRKMLLTSDVPVSDKCEMFLFLADRAQHVEKTIKPAVESGKIVLCDRYTDSTIAYQGFGRGQDIVLLSSLNKIATGGYAPDLTLFFDVSVEESLKRLGNEKDRMESEGNDFMSKVRGGYKEIQKEYPDRIKIIDANMSIDDVFAQTKKYIKELLQKKTGA